MSVKRKPLFQKTYVTTMYYFLLLKLVTTPFTTIISVQKMGSTLCNAHKMSGKRNPLFEETYVVEVYSSLPLVTTQYVTY